MPETKSRLIYKNCFEEREYFETDEIDSLKDLDNGAYSAEVYCSDNEKPYFTMKEVRKSLLVNLLSRVMIDEFRGKKRAHIERVD